jgi:DNA repair protein RadC
MNQTSLFEAPKQKITYAYRISMVRDKQIRYDTEISNALLFTNLVCQTITKCGQDDREQFIIVMLNSKNHVLGTNIISVGTVNSTPVFLREVFKPAITASASAVVVGHNHPSGILEPSREDIRITKKLVTAAKLLDILVHDHVIVNMDTSEYFSFNDKGLLSEISQDACDIYNQLL